MDSKTISATSGSGYPYPPPSYNIQPVPAMGYPHPVSAAQSNIVIIQPQLQSNTVPVGWMDVPLGIPNCPPGLEYLTALDQLLIKQKVNITEVFTGFEMNMKFQVKNVLGQDIYWAVEDNDCCTRNCFGSFRPFDMKVLDAAQNEVMHFYLPLRCSSCCFPCCLQEMEVSSSGQVLGRVEQEWTCWYPNYSVKNHAGETGLRIEGPFCTISCGNDVNFRIVSLDGIEVGRISKQWSGLTREIFTTADYFGINFPLDLHVRMKAVMLGACMLINSMFYESKNRSYNNNDQNN